jgi:large subunit ribosomal protein L10
MNRDQKAAVIEEIAGQIQEAEAVFAVDYRGISVPQAAELRGRLRDAEATFRVVKNSLTERAADRAGAEQLKELLEGPTALTFVHGDAALAAKAIADFGRGTDLLPFKGGLLDGVPVEPDQIRAIARLPARDVLYGQLVGVVAHPLSGLVRTLNALIQGLAIQLGQIAEQGLVEGAAEPEAPAEAEAGAEPEAPAAAEAAAEPEAATEAEAGAEAEAEAPAEPEAAVETPEQAEPESAPADNETDTDATPSSGDGAEEKE